MFETTVVISKRRTVRAAFVASLPLALGAHVLLAAAWLSADLWDVRFPIAPPAAFASYRMLVAVAVPPPPPPPPAAPRPRQETVRMELPDNVAPSVIPDVVPDLEPPDPMVSSDELGVEGGVEGGIAGGQIGGVVGGIVGAVIAEATPPDTIIVPRDARLPVRPISMEYPMYPEKWRLRRVEDRVILRYTIDDKGRVSDVRILFPATFPEFNEVSIKAIRGWRFHPLEIDGVKKSVVHELTINFKIEQPMRRMPTRKRDDSGGQPATAHH
jgi:protein TonB